MKRPWQVWLVFAVCVLGAAGAMAWLTREAVDADRMRRSAQAQAELEQRVSLAVWRMDTELAPIIAAEVIRPAAAFRPGVVAADLPQFVLLQFQVQPNETWQSPQMPAPQPPWLARLQELSRAVSYETLLADLPSTPLPTAAELARNNYNVDWGMAANAPGTVPNENVAMNAPASPELPQQGENQYQFFEGNRGNNFPNSNVQLPQQAPNGPPIDQQAQAVPSQQLKEADFQKRSKRYQTAAQQSLFNSAQSDTSREELANEANDKLEGDAKPNVKSEAKPSIKGSNTKGASPTTIVEQVGVSRPVWVGDRLLLARRVARGGTTLVQGCWLDWPQLKARLLGEASDLLPKADLVPVNGDGADDPSRMLAGLPVRLVVNESVANIGVGPTLQWALWMGWGAVLVAVLAAAALLHGVMTLSERRAAFVSSVTHELRTPLTTFRMYAEMLARGMVPDAARRQAYYETLQKESERLSLLVENVLAYARLERGRKPQAQDRVTVVDLLQRVRTRLEQRAAQAGMECVVELNKKTASQEFTTDLAVVEQILFNLVDNAAKYARNASDRRIHVEANHLGQYVTFTVRDHGPGIGNEAVDRTQPFEKSAQESAETAPGVGLGLALCRRLARQLGGRLEVAGANGEGAMVTLMLPV
jgi:signal transduction histidine kinase